MNQALKLVQTIHAAMLGSIALEAVIGEIAGPGPRSIHPALSCALATMSVAVVGTVFVVRKTLALPSELALAQKSGDAVAQQQWKTSYLATYVLCESLGIFGVMLRFLGASFVQSLPFYLSGFVMLFFFAPRDPSANS